MSDGVEQIVRRGDEWMSRALTAEARVAELEAKLALHQRCPNCGTEVRR